MNGSIECAFAGRVGTEPELKTSATGKAWIRFSVAIGAADAVQWVQVAAFGDRAQALAESLHKGDRAYVEGNIRLNEWTTQVGEKRAGLSVAAWKVEKLSQIGRNRPAKPMGDARDDRRQQDLQRQSASAPVAARNYQRPLQDDPVPFAPEVR
jgi:single-strand DNA-binding protein